jgi:hypothetical protein
MHAGISIADFSPTIQQRIQQSDEILVEWVFQKKYVDLFYSDPWAFKEKVESDILGEPFTHHPDIKPSSQTLAKLLLLGMPDKYLDKVRIDMCGVAVRTLDTYAMPKSIDFDVLELAYSFNKKLIQLDGQEVWDDERADVANYYACNLDNFLNDNEPQKLLQDEALKKSKYLAGDLSFAHIEDDPDTYEKRTSRWLPKILEELEKGNVFIGVGAGHIVGEKGLKRLLENRGYRVEPES